MFKVYTSYNKSYTAVCIVPCTEIESYGDIILEEDNSKRNEIKSSCTQESGLNQYEGGLRAINHGLLFILENANGLFSQEKKFYFEIPSLAILTWLKQGKCKEEYRDSFLYTLQLIDRLKNKEISVYFGNTPKAKNKAKLVKNSEKQGQYKPEKEININNLIPLKFK